MVGRANAMAGPAPMRLAGPAPTRTARGTISTNGASAIRALSHRANDNDNASCPGQRRHVRACTEWTGRDSVRVTFELSAEAWAMVERALEGVRRRAAVTAVREGEALEGDRQGDPAARSEGMAILGVAPLDDGEALEALARDALSLREQTRPTCSRVVVSMRLAAPTPSHARPKVGHRRWPPPCSRSSAAAAAGRSTTSSIRAAWASPKSSTASSCEGRPPHDAAATK